MAKCKNCGDKFTPVSFNRKYCIENECNDLYYEELKKKALQKWNKEKKVKKENLQTVQELMKLTQIIFNKWIRERDKGQPCISCGKQMREGNIDAGHFWSSGGHKNLTFNEDNVHAQCSRPCNKDKGGDLNNYRIGLIKRIGIERVNYLESEAHKTRKYTREELKELQKKYR